MAPAFAATGDTLERQLRVLPNDLDINSHMNNGRYLTIIDLMLVEYFVRTGFACVMLRKGRRPMSGGAIISYRQGLNSFQTHRLRFRLDASDDHWNYMRFEFVREGRVHAASYMKGAAVARGRLAPNTKSYAAMNTSPLAKPLPAVQHWLAAEQGVMAVTW